MELVAYGAQDIYLTGNPQITFFKVVYRRYTNFSVESIEQTYNGSADYGKKFSCNISRNGDLLNRIYLETDLQSTSPVTGFTNNQIVEESDGLQQVIRDNYNNANVTLNGFQTNNVNANFRNNRLTVNANGQIQLNAGGNHTNLSHNDTVVFTLANKPTLTFKKNNNNNHNGNQPSHWSLTVSGNQNIFGTITTSGGTGTGLVVGQVVSNITTGGVLTANGGTAPNITTAGINYTNGDSIEVKSDTRIIARLTAIVADTTTIDFGYKMIDHVEVEIGGQCIDKQYGEWMNIWKDLTHNNDKRVMLQKMVDLINLEGGKSQKLYIPLQFWFNENPGLALPLIALQYHEVKINVQLKPAPRTDVLLKNICVFCDYIFLDTDERRRFAQVSHEYLIEQIQYSNPINIGMGKTTQTSGQVEIHFNHPVKELVWTLTNDNTKSLVDCDDSLLQLNGHDRFKRRNGKYFRNVQRYQYHSGSAGSLHTHLYSFGINPENHQPSGTCNFSRIDNAVLNVSYTGTNNHTHILKVYGINYNILRIMSGMGGLAYSN